MDDSKLNSDDEELANLDTQPCDPPDNTVNIPGVSSLLLPDAAAEFRRLSVQYADNRDVRQIAEWLEELVQVRAFVLNLQDGLLRIKRSR